MGSPDQTRPVIDEAAVTGLPADADSLRGYHFSRLMRTPLTWILIALSALAAAVAGAVSIGPALGGAAAVGILAVAVLVVFAIADKKAAEDFFEVYATARGMQLIHGRGRLPQATPLLCKGADRYTKRSLVGPLGDGFEGTLALYTYEEKTSDGEGNTQTSYYNYTVGLVEVADCTGFLPELYCQRRSGPRALEKLEDVFRRDKQRLELESTALDEKYEIFAGRQQDPVRLREVFSPTFIVWLTEAAPDRFAFELVRGALCCYVRGHREKAAELDAVLAATGAVAKRLRDEALE